MTLPAQLFAEGVVVRSGDPDGVRSLDDLFAEERHAIAKAVLKRQREYAATRTLARSALAAFGIAPVPLLNGEDRSPRWPRGVVGSLTHTEGLCAVVVASSERFLGLGIDAERNARVTRDLFDHVLTPRERARIEALPEAEQCRMATLVFSAKESLYKCQFPVTGRFVGFQEAEIDVDVALGGFEARFLVPLSGVPEGQRFGGRWAFLPDHVVTSIAWSRLQP